MKDDVHLSRAFLRPLVVHLQNPIFGRTGCTQVMPRIHGNRILTPDNNIQYIQHISKALCLYLAMFGHYYTRHLMTVAPEPQSKRNSTYPLARLMDRKSPLSVSSV